MEENSRDERGQNRNVERTQDSDRRSRNNRQNTSGRQLATNERMRQNENEREDWFTTSALDNYERDSE
jgi:hypothetical protein